MRALPERSLPHIGSLLKSSNIWSYRFLENSSSFFEHAGNFHVSFPWCVYFKINTTDAVANLSSSVSMRGKCCDDTDKTWKYTSRCAIYESDYKLLWVKINFHWIMKMLILTKQQLTIEENPLKAIMPKYESEKWNFITF